MIDWSALVADSALNPPNNEAKAPDSDTACRNQPPKLENVGTGESLAGIGFQGLVPTIPTIPTTFERPRVEEHENNNPLSFIEPVGDGVERQSAPHKTTRQTSCKTCAHLYRPGLSDGHCGGRDDLPFAYTSGHPLRQLPPDGGASCNAWRLHPCMEGADLTPTARKSLGPS